MKHSQMLRQPPTISTKKKLFEAEGSHYYVAHGKLHHLLQILSCFGVNRIGNAMKIEDGVDKILMWHISNFQNLKSS